jgi:hypothetical protein
MHKNMKQNAIFAVFRERKCSKSWPMSPDTPSPIANRYPTWIRRSGLVLASVLLVWLLAWMLVPVLLKNTLETHLSGQLGRQVTLGQIDFKPWSLELTLQDVSVAKVSAGGVNAPKVMAPPQLFIKRIYIDAEIQSLARWAPVVDAIVVDSPHLNLAYKGAGHYDVDDLLATLAARPAEPQASPLRFALYNLTLSDGAVSFTDVPQGKTHQLRQLQISLPFLSNLDSKRDVQVSPKLMFELNGSRFDSTAQSTPFAQTHKTDARLQVSHLDLAPYLGYWPASLPVRLNSAVFSADVKLAFEQAAQASVLLSGQVSATGVQLVTTGETGQALGKGDQPTAASELLSFEQLSVQLKAVRPLTREVQLGRVEWTQPRMTLRRNRAGEVNWLSVFKPPHHPSIATGNVASSPSNTATSASNNPSSGKLSSTAGWTLGVDEVSLREGEIGWMDETLAKPAQLTLSALDLQAHALTWPFKQPMPLEGRARLASATLSFKGTATDQAANVTAKLADMPLGLAAPYLADVFTPTLDGVLNADLGLIWKAATASEASQIQLQVPSLSLNKLVLAGDKKAPLASIKQVQLDGVAVDLGRRTLAMDHVRVTQPQTRVTRAADGRWMFQEWFKPGPAPLATPPQLASADGEEAWSMVLNELQLAEGQVSYQDNAQAKPVVLDVSAVSAQVKNLSTLGTQPFGLNLTARVRHGHPEPGTLSWRGTGTRSPLALQGDLTAERLPLHALAPYASDRLNVALLRVDTSFKGRLSVAQQSTGLALQLHGDTRLEDVRVQTQRQAEPFVPKEELLSWKSLNLQGLDVAVNPEAATRVDVQGAVLSDFYARLVLDEAGRFNLQDVMKPASPEASITAPTAEVTQNTTKTVAASPGKTVAKADFDIDGSKPSHIRVGAVSLLGGRVDFTDRFIKPNYSAELSELAGKLSAFSTQPVNGEVQLADLELRGRAEGSATLEVLGKINPLAKPLALDIQGRVRDLELPPLSPYAVRYAGYGIERGKLSVDVAYKVQPDGQLTANNNIILNQLKFGDQVPNAPTSLPVKLAVALLADRNGVIDVNLPVNGSLNDPQFRLMPVIFRIIGNLIVKAIASPFSLLASALGGSGGDELSMVSFEPGSAVLTASAKLGLDKVAKALQDRPALKMTVVGTASLDLEREAYKREQLRDLVQAEKRRKQTQAGSAEATAASTDVPAQDYPALLKSVYRRADFPKPRNLMGLAKDLPVPEMEALLLAHLDASESAIQALALRRGVAVRDYLASLKLPADRLFLGAAKAVPPEAKWQPRAELNLAIN